MKQQPGYVVKGLKFSLIILYGLPLVWIILTSVKKSTDVFKESLFFTPSLNAYEYALSPELVTALKQSLIIASATTALVVIFATPAAYGLARIRGPIVSIGLGLLIVLQMLPQTANIIPLFQILASWGLLDNTLGVIIADTALLIPFAVLLLRPFFRSVPIQTEEAAAIDGAGTIRTFLQIALPIARNGVLTVATIIYLIAWGEFLYAVNLLLSPKSYPLSALLAQQVSAFGINWPGLMALAVITSVPILVLFVASYKLLRDGLTVGAVK